MSDIELNLVYTPTGGTARLSAGELTRFIRTETGIHTLYSVSECHDTVVETLQFVLEFAAETITEANAGMDDRLWTVDSVSIIPIPNGMWRGIVYIREAKREAA